MPPFLFRKIAILFCFFVLSYAAYAQKFTISGYIEDAKSSEKLIGATVYDKATLQGTTTNVYGFYSLTLPQGVYDITFSYVGFQAQTISIDLTQNITKNVQLQSTITLQEVEITAEHSEKIEERTQMSSIEIPIRDIQMIPALLGERDVLKAIQLLPGVQSGGEGTSGLYVRGGGPDQNLILLDGVPVYNASHLFGFFSVFNPDALNHVSLVKGGFPARYGGRLSSVLDIRMKEGNMKKFAGSATIGLVAAKFTLEGPIIKDKTSFIISARRTYIDILARPLIKNATGNLGAETKTGYYFYDLNGKINHKFSDKSRLYLSAYTGDDIFYANIHEKYVYDNEEYSTKIDAGLDWGNRTLAMRWNYIISNKLFANTTLTYSKYRFNIGEKTEQEYPVNNKKQKTTFDYNYTSGIKDWAGKIDFDYLPTPKHYIKFGASSIYHTFTPGINVFKSSFDTVKTDTTFGAKSIFGHETELYIEDDFAVGARLKFNVGLHFTNFHTNQTNYPSLQPRVSGRYLLSESLSLKASYANMAQFIHLLANAGIGLPTDLWVPATDTIKPMYSNQVAIGIAKTVKRDYEFSFEAYYKTMENLLEYKEGASFFSAASDWYNQVEVGRGWAYGFEWFLQKKSGKTTGWIGYTLSWSWRQFDNLNLSNPFPYRYDRRHDLSFVFIHTFSERLDFALTWVYGTGNAVTLANERYAVAKNPFGPNYYDYFDDDNVESFKERNGYRMRAYHRLDVGINLNKKLKYGNQTWSFGAYNVYSRRNPFYVYFSQDYTGKRVLKQVSLFPIIPSVSYTFNF
jgi:hypothetical protein